MFWLCFDLKNWQVPVFYLLFTAATGLQIWTVWRQPSSCPMFQGNGGILFGQWSVDADTGLVHIKNLWWTLSRLLPLLPSPIQIGPWGWETALPLWAAATALSGTLTSTSVASFGVFVPSVFPTQRYFPCCHHSNCLQNKSDHVT